MKMLVDLQMQEHRPIRPLTHTPEDSEGRGETHTTPPHPPPPPIADPASLSRKENQILVKFSVKMSKLVVFT